MYMSIMQLEETKLLSYMKQAVTLLLERGQFENGWKFNDTQREAYEALDAHLNRQDISDTDKLEANFLIATGQGKSAFAAGILGALYEVPGEDGEDLTLALSVPDNTLLDQTPKDIIEVSPSLKDKIGLCGDDNEDLDKSLLIMNNVARDRLLDNGKIGPHNIDGMFVDEAHRSISKRRIERKEEVFDSAERKVFQFGWTATKKFNHGKTVDMAYKNTVYELPLREAILKGRAASYAQSQLMIIRIDPSEFDNSEEFNNATTSQQADYRQQVTEKAWADAVVKAHKHGLDEMTHKPLSDHVAGFFTMRTRQADDVARRLNEDPFFIDKAKALGFEKPSVPIHTKKISKREQKQRLRDVKANETYLSLTGYGKFKEGFDNKRLKVVYRPPSKSLVDSEQIIGRAARQCIDETTNESLGLTIVDTLTYIGSSDPDEDAALKRQLLEDAYEGKFVLTQHILEDSAVYSPAVSKGYDLKLLNAGDHMPENAKNMIFLQQTSNNQFHIRISAPENKKPKDDQILYADYIEFNEETKTLIQSIFDQANDKVFQRQTYRHEMAKQLRRLTGHLQTFPEPARPVSDPFSDDPNVEYHVEFSDLYQLHKDMEQAAERNNGREDITAEQVKVIQDHAERTGKGGTLVFRDMAQEIDGFTLAVARGFVSQGAQSLPVGAYDAMLAIYKTLPDAENKIEREPITAEQVKVIRDHAKRTGKGGRVVFGKIEKDIEGFTPVAADFFVRDGAQSLPVGAYDAILAIYEVLPDTEIKVKVEREPITAEQVKVIQDHAKRTGKGGRVVFGKIEQEIDGFNAGMAKDLVSAGRKSLPIGAYDAMLAIYETLPDAEIKVKAERETITPKQVEVIQDHAKRTGMGGRVVFGKIEKDIEGFKVNAAKIFVAKGGKSLPVGAYDAMLAIYETLPDAEIKVKAERETITAKQVEVIQGHAKRTGKGGTLVFRDMAQEIDGFTLDVAKGFVSQGAQSLPVGAYDAMLAIYESLPDAKPVSALQRSMSKAALSSPSSSRQDFTDVAQSDIANDTAPVMADEYDIGHP